jgi:dTDP-4-amino-4,6-dideoxygalactose transaminase
MHSWPPLDPEILTALESAYRDGSWATYWGPHVKRLEHRLAEYHDVPHAMTCGSGTFAVELALRSVKVSPGDEVIMAAYDFPGNFLTIHALGATPVLVDITAHNWNLDPDQLDSAWSDKTKAIIVSHLHGGVVPMSQVMAWAERRGVKVIEDACQCPGAMIEGRRSATRGDVGVLSFGGSKLLTAGRGGAILTRHADVFHRARIHQMRGNLVCPLSELQAAVLPVQLDKLDARNAVRAENVRLLTERLGDVAGLRPFLNRVAQTQPAYYKLGLQFSAEEFGLSREQFVTAVRAEGVSIDEGFRALHMGRSSSRFRTVGSLTEVERAHNQCVVLHHPVLLGLLEDIDAVVTSIDKVRTQL